MLIKKENYNYKRNRQKKKKTTKTYWNLGVKIDEWLATLLHLRVDVSNIFKSVTLINSHYVKSVICEMLLAFPPQNA